MKNQIKTISIALIIVVAVVASIVGGLVYICSHNENLLYYGNTDFSFVTCVVGSGRSEQIFCGAISNVDYQRWVNGEVGTLVLYNNSNRSYRISIDKITTMSNHGSTPDWLPVNFH